MIALLLMAAMTPPMVALACAAGTNARSQTPLSTGPDGSQYALAVRSDDDHLKATHLCLSAYQIVIARPGQPAGERTLNFSVDDRYGRSLVISLEGFAGPSQPLRILGIACEEGVGATAFAYDPGTGAEVDIDLRAAMIPGRARCSTGLRVAGTTLGGAMVVARGKRLWQARRGTLRPFSRHGGFVPLAPPAD